MKRLLPSLGTSVRWPMVLGGGLAAAATVAIYLFRLGSLIGTSSAEQQTIATIQSFGAIVGNPILIAYKLPATLLAYIFNDPLIAARLAAVGLAMVSGVLFYLLARRWYGRLHGASTTLLFLASSWMLHTGRYAAGYGVFIVMILALINSVVWVTNCKDEQAGRALVLYGLISSLALFVPGGVWFVLAAALLSRQRLISLLAKTSLGIRLTVLTMPSLAIASLVAACLRDTAIVRQALGLPAAFPDLVVLSKQAVFSVSSLLVRGPATPEVWLAHTPVLDIAGSVLLLLGVVFYARHLRSSRTRLLASFGVIGVILISLNGAVALGYIVPLAYIIIGAGLTYLFHQWKRTFPRNPIANVIALAAFGILVSCMVSFHLQRYFIAWRYSPNTSEVYRQAETNRPALPYLIQ